MNEDLEAQIVENIDSAPAVALEAMREAKKQADEAAKLTPTMEAT